MSWTKMLLHDAVHGPLYLDFEVDHVKKTFLATVAPRSADNKGLSLRLRGGVLTPQYGR